MTEMLTRSIQDYLKTIYDLSADGKPASTNELAERLGIKPASITGMIQRLARDNPPLVHYQKHQGVTLTPEGRRAALKVIRRHRLLETYLVESLGYAWDEVHSEADRLEHAISEEFEARIANVLGHPTRDPHGELIPTADLVMPVENSTPLSSLQPNQTAVIQMIRNADTDLLRYLENLGLVPGAQIEVTKFSPFDRNTTIKVGGKTAVIGANITNRIFIEKQ